MGEVNGGRIALSLVMRFVAGFDGFWEIGRIFPRLLSWMIGFGIVVGMAFVKIQGILGRRFFETPECRGPGRF